MIKLNNNNYTIRVNIQILTKNKSEFLSYFDLSLVKWLYDEINNEEKILKLLKTLKFKFPHIYNKEDYINEFTYELNGNAYIKDFYINYFRYHPEHRIKMMAKTNTGKKRPKHSAKMKIIMKGIKKSKEHKQNLKIHNNNNYFRKRLYNLGELSLVDSQNLPLIKIKEIYSKVNSEHKKTFIYKRNCIYNNINKYKDYISNYKNKWFPLNEFNINDAFKDFNSIKSTVASKNPLNNMGSYRFERAVLTGLKYNIKDITMIKVKSSYEKNSILFFEENKIYWDYEPKTISYNNNLNRYTIDFLAIYNNIKYFIEIKGFVGNTNKKILIKSEEFIKQLNINEKFIFLRKSFDSIEDFNQVYTKKNINKIKEIIC